MSNYAPQIPRDTGGEALQDFPAPKKALARYTGENASASSVLSVSHDTTSLEVAAVGQAAVLRWIATSDTQASVISIAGATSNYDHVIPSGTLRRFAIPVETYNAASGYGSVVGANRNYGLYQRVAVKSVGIGSVMTAEFGQYS